MDSVIHLLRSKSVQGIKRDPSLVTRRLQSVYRSMQSSWDAPTQADKLNMKFGKQQLQGVLEAVNHFYADILPGYRQAVEDAGLKLIADYGELTLK